MAGTEGEATERRRGSLYLGFEGYRTPSPADYRLVLGGGLVVPDANVLLNLYRYTDQARDDLLSVLERLGDRLWVPHQVVVEFWRNRESVLRDPRDTEKAAGAMQGAKERATNEFRAWANRVSLPADRSSQVLEGLSAGFDAAINEIDHFSDTTGMESARDTDKDAVLKRLEQIVAGRVGPELDASAYRAAVTEGLRRVEARQPPGYLDKNKDDERATGDYLVWEQVLREAEQRGCDVAFVTGDVKEDWWRREAGELRGPRLELSSELRKRAGVALFMLRPTRLLSLASEALSLRIHDESVETADRVDRLLAVSESPSGGGWTVAALELLLARLHEEAPVQREVIDVAARQGGFVDRDTVYEVGRYDEARSLRGFTRPINRLAQSLRDEGFVSATAVDVLDTVYSAQADNPSMAVGFELNAVVLPLISGLIADGTEDA